jgi:hypothetical protein
MKDNEREDKRLEKREGCRQRIENKRRKEKIYKNKGEKKRGEEKEEEKGGKSEVGGRAMIE